MASIGDLVANLRANSAPLSAGLAAAQQSVGKFASFTRQAMAPIAGAFAGAFSVSGMLQAAGERGRAEKMLASQVASTGEAAGLSAQQMVEYAQSLQKTTGFSAAATEGAMSLLTTFRNIKGDQFKDAIKQAQNLSTVLGVDLRAATSVVGKALNDPVNSLKMLRREGIMFTAEQQRQIATMQASGDMAGAQKVILDNLQASFGGAAQNMASPMAMLHNSVEELAGNFGEILGPSIKVVAQTLLAIITPLTEARGSLQALGKLTAQFLGAVLLPFASGLAQTAQLLMGMFVGGSVTAADFGNVASLAMNNVTLGVMNLLPNGEKIFTAIGIYGAAAWEAISAAFWAQWENIKSGWTSLVDISKAVGGAIYAAMKAAWNMEDPIAAATTAFKTAMAQMRQTNFTNPLTAGMDAFNNTVRDATQGLKEQGGLKAVLTVDRDSLKKKVADAIAGLPKQAEVKLPDFAKAKKGESGLGGKPSKSKGGGEHRDDKLEAFEANSKEALQSLAEASRAGAGDNESADQTANNTAEMNETLKSIDSSLRRDSNASDCGTGN